MFAKCVSSTLVQSTIESLFIGINVDILSFSF
ncbi:hypothetical protein ACUW9N_001819 [Staphylococcus auricularis]